MRSELRLAVAAVALLLVAAAPDTAVTLPFAPPTGVPIRYDCTALRTVGGRPLTITTAHELQFAGTADKRSVRWTVKSLAVSGDEPVRKMLQATGDMAVGQPVDIALTADGATAAITNEAALRVHVRAAIPSWLDVVEPLLGGEAPLVPGAVVEADVEAQAPIGGGALRYKLRYGLRDYVPGKSAQVFHDLTADPEDVQRYAAEMVAQMFPDAAPGQNEATATRAILSQMTSGTQITSDISLPTGLRTRFSTATTTELPGRPKRIESRECRLVSRKVL
jgi:hypothetical protein